MPRRYYRRRSIGSRDKYSVEQTLWRISLTQASPQQYAEVVPATTIKGMRKVKHLTIQLSNMPAAEGWPLYYALVYVPEGYDANTLNVPSDNAISSLYEPNQFVMAAGILDTTSGPNRIHCPIARNLNSGDKIVFIIACPGLNQNAAFTGIVRYAITLQ